MRTHAGVSEAPVASHGQCTRHIATRVAVVLAVLLAAPPRPSFVLAGEEGGASSLSSRFRRVGQLSAPLPEISGWAPLPARAGSSDRRFLAVVDEGAYHPADGTVRGALHVLSFAVDASDAVALTATRPVTLRLGDHIPRIDPGWAGGPSVLDLEACVPLPGTQDLYLLAGERNPEDATDGGANRLYVVRYPGRAEGEADMLAYLRLPDLADDAINDRFEGVVATSRAEAHTWRVFAFKERTDAPDRAPAYFPLVLRLDTAVCADTDAPEERAPTFELGWLGGRVRRRLPALLADRARLGAQADACVAADGRIWVLDRWRREVHVAEEQPSSESPLRHVETLDLFDLVADVPGEQDAGEPGAPGSAHAGYGRHEAIAFDARGWLWLAADLGGGQPSVVTVLAPRGASADGDRTDAADGEGDAAPGSEDDEPMQGVDPSPGAR